MEQGQSLVPALQEQGGDHLLPPQTKSHTGQQLKHLGLYKAAEVLEQQEKAVEQWGMAYAHFPFVTPEQIQAFRQKCAGEHRVSPKGYHMEKLLVLTPLAKYPSVPPTEVLGKLKAAQDLSIFDSYEVAHIEWQEVIPDPILFGRVKDCPDYFLIAQWGEDVRFEDLAR